MCLFVILVLVCVASGATKLPTPARRDRKEWKALSPPLFAQKPQLLQPITRNRVYEECVRFVCVCLGMKNGANMMGEQQHQH